jgi:rhodanese-related sulfurtransferase
MPRTIDELLREARARLRRPGPQEAAASGAQLVDIRTVEQRRADGVIPGALWFPRNVLEWRFDPASDARDPRTAGHGEPIVVFCDAGYASSFAAVSLQELGFEQATDLDGGFQAWKAAGLPVAPLEEEPG